MNLIQQQASIFYKRKFSERGKYEEFIQNLRTQLFEYRKDSHKLEFIDYLIIKLKQGYDKHLPDCPNANDSSKCMINSNYENSLFFIQNERDEIIENLPKSDFTPH